jgi:uncharacterized membrane protein
MASSSTCTLTRDIRAPLSEVWDLLLDVRRLPEISPSTVAVAGPRRLRRVGDRFDQTVRLAGKRFTSTWEVTELQERRRLQVTGSVLPGTRYSMTEQLDERPGDRTRLTLEIDYSLPFGPLGRLAAKLGAERRALDEADGVLAGIARLTEAGDAAAANAPSPSS